MTNAALQKHAAEIREAADRREMARLIEKYGHAWSTEWPKEAGWYWFLGYVSREDRVNFDGSPRPPQLRMAQVRRSRVVDKFYYVINTGYIERTGETLGAKWSKAIVPTMPEVKDESAASAR